MRVMLKGKHTNVQSDGNSVRIFFDSNNKQLAKRHRDIFSVSL